METPAPSHLQLRPEELAKRGLTPSAMIAKGIPAETAEAAVDALEQQVANHLAEGMETHQIVDALGIDGGVVRRVTKKLRTAPKTIGTAKDPLAGIIHATDLMATEFAPIEYVVPGIIPEGLAFLVAAPKIGKSWMVLGLAAAAAAGGQAFGSIDIDQRPVLYLALEDGPRRLQSRLLSLGVTNVPAGLDLLTTVDDPMATMTAYAAKHAARHPLIILDTLGKVMPDQGANETTYLRDYRVGSVLKKITDTHPGSSIIAVHHTRKAGSSDFLDSVSGTQGLAGAADTILVLRRERNTDEATLNVTSRDAAEGEYAMQLADNGAWTLTGGSLDTAAHAASAVKAKAGVGDLMQQILDEVGKYPEGVDAKTIAAALPDVSVERARTYLARANDTGRLRKLGRGKYAPLDPTAWTLDDALQRMEKQEQA